MTPEWTVGVWYGNKSGTPDGALVGAKIAAPVAGSLQYYLNQGRPVVWPEDVGLVSRELCRASGLAPTPFCQETQPGVVVNAIPLRRCAQCQQNRLAAVAVSGAKLLSPAPGIYRAGRSGELKCTLKTEPEECHVYLDGDYLGKLKSGARLSLARGSHLLLVWPGEGQASAQAAIVVQ